MPCLAVFLFSSSDVVIPDPPNSRKRCSATMAVTRAQIQRPESEKRPRVIQLPPPAQTNFRNCRAENREVESRRGAEANASNRLEGSQNTGGGRGIEKKVCRDFVLSRQTAVIKMA